MISGQSNGVLQHSGAGAQVVEKLPPLNPTQLFRGARFVVVGGTGFLGKVWISMLLQRFPELGHLYLLVRAKEDQSPEERFWSQIASSATFDPIRADHPGAEFEAFLREKITPVNGDVIQDHLGIDRDLIERLRGTISAVVNVSGVVDFNPPLDEALEVNAFGVNNIVTLARTLNAPVMHTSTCYVAGYRAGRIDEIDPERVPFPRAAGAKVLGESQRGRTLDRSHWDPQREISECLDLVKQARQRADDAFRQSAFVDTAKKNLEERGEPCRGSALEDETKKVRRKFVEAQLIEAGTERALFWGWSNIYTYTKSIGEQVLAASGVRYSIVRPAVIESSCIYPFPGWNEGINTSAPFIFMALKGTVRFPGSKDVHLDIIPVDMVASGMIASLAELLDGRGKLVYQYGVTDVNGCSMARYMEIIGLYKRNKVFKGESTKPLELILAQFESMGLEKKDYLRLGPHQYSSAMKTVSSLLDRVSLGPLAAIAKPTARLLQSAAKGETRSGDIMDLFLPFVAEADWVFSCANTRAALDRMPPEERAKFFWEPEKIDWLKWMFEVHLPGLEKWVFPQIEDRMVPKMKAIRAYDHLLDVLDEAAERHEHALALSDMETDGLSRTTYREWQAATYVVAERLLESGVRHGDRVLVSGKNRTAWGLAYFGILRAGCVAVPVDPALEPAQFTNIARTSSASIALLDDTVKAREGLGRALPNLTALDLVEISRSTPNEAEDLKNAFRKRQIPSTQGEDVASVIYTSGTTGEPKGVLLTHANFAGLLAALAPLFPLTRRDRVLSVLPLHHTFEFTCGLLLPLMLGARILYIQELNATGLREGLSKGRVTAMAGVPALWQLLEKRILSEVKERGPVAAKAFDLALELNRLIGKNTGINAGRLFFGTVHQELGGNIRHLISGGAALPRDTAKLFAGLGLHLSEGYGLTEASPVLTVAKASPKASFGHVGKAVPGVEVRIDSPDESGVGEVVARGPNIMKGYENNVEATKKAIDEQGWLHTGDLGKFDKRGQLVIVGRHKEVIVGPSGENVYPDDVETLLGTVSGVKELSIVGLPDGSGGEKVACLAVPAPLPSTRAAEDEPAVEESAGSRAERHKKAQSALREAFEKLPRVARPTVVHLYDADLPRTATRKVKRSEVRAILERVSSAASTPREAGSSPVRHVLANLTNRSQRDISPEMSLRGDLGIDSLLGVELTVALEAQLGEPVDAAELSRAETVADLEEAVRRSMRSALAVDNGATIEVAEEPISVPAPVTEVAKRVMTQFQMGFYDRAMRPHITGRAHIPYNRNTIVVSNHASHLDMGFVKYALGAYGEGLVTLAAQDYFFEGNRWRRFYIENLTNLAPFDRKGGLRNALRLAGDLLNEGKTILIFPEGTRSKDGAIQEFKPVIGHLALSHEVDILPVYLGGTYEAMRKGTRIPTKRDITAKIGLPLRFEDLRRLTDGMKPAAAYRKIAGFAETAVRDLKEGKILDLAREGSSEAPAVKAEHPLTVLFRELEGRYKAGRVEKPITYYFTLGAEQNEKWTLRVDPAACHAEPGKPEGAPADCVLKTSTEIFTRIVREAYTPSPMEFISGAVKSNDLGLLQTFQKVFDLN